MPPEAQLLENDANANANASTASTSLPSAPTIQLPLIATIVLSLALFGSGAAGLMNQVIWQRSLKVWLGGSESICSMVVVLVFMAGLGLGSIAMSKWARKLKSPLRTFCWVEIALALVNICISNILSTDISHSVFAVAKVALAAGIPLLLLYGLIATITLAIPCLLMGMTMPLAAETCQRDLGIRNARVLGLLLFINTLGSVLGTIFSSGTMLPILGQSKSLLLAAGLNGLAAALLLALYLLRRRNPKSLPSTNPSNLKSASRGWRPNFEEKLALGLGFCSLGYEMYLFRLIPLRHEPLPFTFAAVLTGFLLFWSLGAALSSQRRTMSLSLGLRLCALTSVISIPMFVFDQPMAIKSTLTLVLFVLAKTPYFIPCLLFGYLFGQVSQRAAKSWGEDIGRLYAWNTLGACLGILLTTFVGYEMPFFAMVLVLALLLFAMQEYTLEKTSPNTNAHSARRWTLPLTAALATVVGCLTLDLSQVIPQQRMYSGRDGVIMIQDNGDLVWDGLWHSKLSQNDDHIATNNWSLAVCPVICHPTGKIEDVCVIGMGTGITAGTLAKLTSVKQIDGYEISTVLKQVYRDYPTGTLDLLHNKKIHLIWQDARTGLALSPKQYDLIQAQPLYLKQAGSSLLNSVEFFHLVKQRLKPGGVFCLYSNGTAEQAFTVRETADQVFPHRVSFFDGYLVVLSSDPITLDAATLASRLGSDDPLWKEIRNNPPTSTGNKILSLVDTPKLPAGNGSLVVTDDYPLVEYPDYLALQLKQMHNKLLLPAPTPTPAPTATSHSTVEKTASY